MKLNNSEITLMEMIWDNEPIRSGELVQLAFEKQGWKKSTVYTILKHLTKKGAAVNNDSVVTSASKREEQMHEQSGSMLDRSFGGSLPAFMTAFFGGRKLSKKEAEELKELIDSYTEG